MAPKKERDDVLNDFSARIFSAMLEEVIMDVVLQSHQEVARSNAVCSICHTRCGSIHVPGPSFSPLNGGPSGSQPSPPDSLKGDDNSQVNGPVSGVNTPGSTYYECTNCGRSIASNRFAPHLSSCMGLSNSRRGAARNSTKARLEAGRSASPYFGSENGHLSDDGKSTPKGKAKSKAKQTDEAEFSLHRKRTGSPSVSPAKKLKKAKTAPSLSRPGIPMPLPLSHTNSQSRIPSKLRESSVLSSAIQDRRSSSPDSRVSSPTQSASTPSAFSTIQSPILAGAGVPGRPKTNGSQNSFGNGGGNRFTPPQPPIPVIRVPEPDFLVDVEGEETGSSTDTDSD